MRTHSMEVEVVGMQFRGWTKDGRKMLQRNTSFAVVLEREPENEYDHNAIIVKLKNMSYLETREIGYIRRETAAILAPRMDTGSLAFKSGVCTGIDVDRGTADCTLRFIDTRRAVPARRK